MCKDMGIGKGFKDFGNGKCHNSRTLVRGVRMVTLLWDGINACFQEGKFCLLKNEWNRQVSSCKFRDAHLQYMGMDAIRTLLVFRERSAFWTV